MKHDLNRVMRAAASAVLQTRIDDRRWDDALPSVVIVLEDDAERVVCFETELPGHLPRPYEEVEVLAGAIRAKALETPWGVQPLGVLLAAEAWSLRPPPDATDDEFKATIEEVKRRSIADHPWGVETKMVSGVDITGAGYVSEYVRGDPTDPPPEVLDTTEAREFGGVVVDALTNLLDALTAA